MSIGSRNHRRAVIAFVFLGFVAAALVGLTALANRPIPGFVTVSTQVPGGPGSPGTTPLSTSGASPSLLPTTAASPTASSTGSPATNASPSPTGPIAVLVGAGDIASCASPFSKATAKLIEGIAGTVFTAGDNAYETGSAVEYAKCYDPTWGRFRERTRPAIGNHDAVTADGAAYFAYFGAAAGEGPDGWYSYQAGSWHVVVLNANCPGVDACGPGSRQLAWLESDLAAHPGGCTVAIWHQPRFSSGEHGNDLHSSSFWTALYAAGADLIVNGHDHDYERFAPQTPSGALDPVTGIREIVVGTGGKSLRIFRPTIAANSEVRNSRTYGVLELDLAPGSFTWRFIPIAGQTFTDSGSGVCH